MLYVQMLLSSPQQPSERWRSAAAVHERVHSHEVEASLPNTTAQPLLVVLLMPPLQVRGLHSIRLLFLLLVVVCALLLHTLQRQYQLSLKYDC
jgi:hypothetical protein